ncbi:MAG: hypothetical protein JO121_05150 [Deltaproteobacteria bacterium]|nr:hypothetical protein [Deltaproteobacteria bacterium]
MFNIPTNSTSIQFNTLQFPINQEYDVNLTLLNDGIGLGTADTNCPTDQYGRQDCDLLIQVNNSAAATSCSPVIIAPTDNAVLSGTATVGAAANCNGAYNHLLWSFGPAGGTTQTGFVEIPSGSTTGALNTTQFPSGYYQVSAAAYLTSDASAIVPQWSPLDYFLIQNNFASATSCSPVITAPMDNAVLSGTVTVGAAANCNGAYNHLLWSFGPAGGTTQTGFVEIPSGSTTGALNTTQFPSGYYQVSAAAYLSSDTNAIVPQWSPLGYFSIQH